ncbi:type III secretion system stator protein SctL [Spartinivicinus poritis]|uniref:Type 3 secretion system stator protein n=1 Tax=Spartinivicinus poritis TaxID=2994640 RepID=A0ABT5U4T2_9GAMM|nr:type III secretion system stator protein SctL [Spartinivicinus sp. A2-2]MDE1460996.1 type III secretion system stator protein SctL [Spartinivicinus sp. A2-2]
MFSITDLTQGDFQVAPGTKLIKREQYAKFLSAEQLIEQAKQQAVDIVADAKMLQQQEMEKGFNQGLVEAQQQQTVLVNRTLMECAQFKSQLAAELVQVVLQSVKKIIADYDDIALVKACVAQALAQTADCQQLSLLVAPAMLTSVKDRLDDIKEMAPDIQWDVLPDSSITGMGCKIETPIKVIDTTIDNQLTALEKAVNDWLANVDE